MKYDELYEVLQRVPFNETNRFLDHVVGMAPTTQERLQKWLVKKTWEVYIAAQMGETLPAVDRETYELSGRDEDSEALLDKYFTDVYTVNYRPSPFLDDQKSEQPVGHSSPRGTYTSCL